MSKGTPNQQRADKFDRTLHSLLGDAGVYSRDKSVSEATRRKWGAIYWALVDVRPKAREMMCESDREATS